MIDHKQEMQACAALKAYHIVTIGIYGIAILACLICNLAIQHTLSWFFIVFSSLGIAFSITNLPLLVKKYRMIVSVLGATFFLYLLLFCCNHYMNGDWLFRYGYQIATFPVAVVWLMVLAANIKKLNWYFKSAVISLLCGVLTIFINPWTDAVIAGEAGDFIGFLLSQFSAGFSNYLVNGFIALGFFAYFLVGMVLGTAARLKSKSSTAVS